MTEELESLILLEVSANRRKSLFKQNPSVEVAPLQEEFILFQPSTGKFFVLNRTSSFIWTALREPATAQDIAAKVRSGFKKAESDAVVQDVDTLLQQMLSENLILNA